MVLRRAFARRGFRISLAQRLFMTKKSEQPKNDNLQPRPPVVVVLGHVDHGKSSLLEAIRKDFKITSRESGGITQHVGAYEAEHQGKKITFIDTPGHEAFSAIRSRGAKVADVAVLVVSAEEGVKEQTEEAILHAKKADIPIIVAINKIDKPAADPEKVKRELIKRDILVESLGGKIPSVSISAKETKGIEELLDVIILVAEISELKARRDKPAEGVVIESYLDSRRGPTATLLVLEGKLIPHNIIATESATGKVRILENFQGESIKEALPSMPAIVVGWDRIPGVGEKFKVLGDIGSAAAFALKAGRKRHDAAHVVEAGKKIINVILKVDVLGSAEAIEAALYDIPQEEIALRIIDSGAGDITDSDIQLAKSADAIIVGFRTKVSAHSLSLADRYGIKIRTFDVIYELIQEVRRFMQRRLAPVTVRKDLGKMKVLIVFMTEKNRQIVGGKIIEGEVKKGAAIEVVRGQEIVAKGKIINLQKNKKDVDDVKKGEEAGILYDGNGKIMEGDVLTFYVQETQKIGL